MTDLMEKAITELSKLPGREQDAVAALILEELASERRWIDSFAASEDLLSKLADEALVSISESGHGRFDGKPNTAQKPPPFRGGF
jgi:hypothetical protein